MQLWSAWEGSVIRTNSGAGSTSATAASGCSHPPQAPPAANQILSYLAPGFFQESGPQLGRVCMCPLTASATLHPHQLQQVADRNQVAAPPMKTPGGARQGMTSGLCG